MATGQRPRPRLSYTTDVDPAMSTFGWKVIGLTYIAVLLPGLGAFLPRDVPVNWPWLWLALACAAFTLAVNAVHLRRMIASGGYEEPSASIVLAEVAFGTVAAGILNFALCGPLGIYRPLIFIPTLLIAMIANRAMIAIAWTVAVVTVTVSSSAQGIPGVQLWAFGVSYGAAWGAAAVMVHMLATTSLRSDRQMLGLADAATIAARATTLADGLDQMLPVVGQWAEARRVAAYRLEASGYELLARWPHELDAVAGPTPDEIATARQSNGVLVDGSRWLLFAESAESEQLAITIDGSQRPMFDLLMHRFDLERMAVQIDILVNRSRYIERLESLGMTDGLTGLPNRRSLTDRLETEMRSARRRGDPLALAMLDLDEFKGFNDAHGHVAGDALLKCFATMLTARLRSVDFVARYGGEEFCVVLPGTDAAGAESLLAEVHRDAHESEGLRDVTFSAGVAVWNPAESSEDLVSRADRALYAAKDAGKDRTTISGRG